ncbi:DNA-binding protein HEXBP-like [Trifolium pratense]|uniref:DNA-binding protein HEXBP-like n=1 Tax=Trifolium pratense TaxID=57577 RepID=UPI001E695AA4|nr:DNA-binding protein HEXBP-like [Trifolium pratense]
MAATRTNAWIAEALATLTTLVARDNDPGRNQEYVYCYKCGERGHKPFECPKELDKCLRCGRMGHKTEACRGKLTCYDCGEDGHKSVECKKPKQVVGKVFALGDEDGKAKSSYYKAMKDRKGKGLERSKPYDIVERGSSSGRKKQGNGQCYKCGARGHISYGCPLKDDKCFNCGKLGHKAEGFQTCLIKRILGLPNKEDIKGQVL